MSKIISISELATRKVAVWRKGFCYLDPGLISNSNIPICSRRIVFSVIEDYHQKKFGIINVIFFFQV